MLLNPLAIAQKPYIVSLLAVVAKAGEDTGTVIAYRMLTGITTTTDPAKAVMHGKAGIVLGKLQSKKCKGLFIEDTEKSFVD